MHTQRLISTCSIIAVTFSGCNERQSRDLEIAIAKNEAKIESIEKDVSKIQSEHQSREESTRKEISENSSKIVLLEAEVEQLKQELSESKSGLATAMNDNVQVGESLKSLSEMLKQIKNVDQKTVEAEESRRSAREAMAAPIKERIANLTKRRTEELSLALEITKTIEKGYAIYGATTYPEQISERDQILKPLEKRLQNIKEAIRQIDIAIQNERDRLNDL